MDHETRATLIEQLKADEGVRLTPYVDTTSHLTIGIGRNLDDVGITLSEAEYLCGNDVDRVEGAVLDRWPWAGGLDDARFGVLVNMAFNLGVAGLAGFHQMLAALEADDYDRAADEMLDSIWASQVGARADRLVEQMRTGQWVVAG